MVIFFGAEFSISIAICVLIILLLIVMVIVCIRNCIGPKSENSLQIRYICNETLLTICEDVLQSTMNSKPSEKQSEHEGDVNISNGDKHQNLCRTETSQTSRPENYEKIWFCSNTSEEGHNNSRILDL